MPQIKPTPPTRRMHTRHTHTYRDPKYVLVVGHAWGGPPPGPAPPPKAGNSRGTSRCAKTGFRLARHDHKPASSWLRALSPHSHRGSTPASSMATSRAEGMRAPSRFCTQNCRYVCIVGMVRFSSNRRACAVTLTLNAPMHTYDSASRRVARRSRCSASASFTCEITPPPSRRTRPCSSSVLAWRSTKWSMRKPSTTPVSIRRLCAHVCVWKDPSIRNASSCFRCVMGSTEWGGWVEARNGRAGELFE